MEDWFSVG